MQVQLNKKNENPFYGMSQTLTLYQGLKGGNSINSRSMESAWSEANTSEKKQLLFSLLFAAGDVTGRQHNLFEGNRVDSGGFAQRDLFRDTILPFLFSKVKSLPMDDQFKFLDLVVEYTVMDNLFATRVRTKVNKRKVLEVIDMIEVFGVELLAQYAAKVIRKGTHFQKVCLAKFLPLPKSNFRPKALDATKELNKKRLAVITRLSVIVGYDIVEHQNNTEFAGFKAFKRKYGKDFDSYLFSTGAINDMDKEAFIDYVSKVPSDSRHRIKNRVMYNEKWTRFKPWFELYVAQKESAQQDVRDLKVQLENADESEKEDIASKLKKATKNAKVNTGAFNYSKELSNIINGTADNLKIEAFMQSVSLAYNTLLFIDDSGSMQSRPYGNSYDFTPFNFASFIATTCMLSNPDPEARNLVGLFSQNCRMFSTIDTSAEASNSLMRANIVRKPNSALIDPKLSFMENFERFKNFLYAKRQGRMTNLASIPNLLSSMNDHQIEMLRLYPVWTIISDGNFNNQYSVESSFSDAMRICENRLGFRPFVLLIDVAGGYSADIKSFTGLDNILMVPPSPSNIELILTNFKDIDVYDVYTALQSIYRSNRYANVQKFVSEQGL